MWKNNRIQHQHSTQQRDVSICSWIIVSGKAQALQFIKTKRVVKMWKVSESFCLCPCRKLFTKKAPCHCSGCDKLQKAMTSYHILEWCTFKTNGPFEANSADTDTSKPCVSLLGVVKKGAPRLALWDAAHMGFRRWRGESGTHEVLSQPPGKKHYLWGLAKYKVPGCRQA